MPEPRTINVVSPEGHTYGVPEEQLSAYLSQGFTPESSEDLAQRAYKDVRTETYGGTGGAIKAAGLGALSGLTAGLSDVAISGLGGREALQGYKEENPVSSFAGNFAGSLAPALFTGGASAGAEAGLIAKGLASTPAGAISKLGHAVSSGLAGEGAGVLAKAGAATVGAGVEGAIYGGGQYLSETALENKPLSAEGFVGGMGKGALFAAPVGGGFSLAGSALLRARSLFPRSELSKEAGKVVQQEATTALKDSLSDGDAMLAAAKQQMAENEAKAGVAAGREHITRTAFGGAAPDTLVEQAAAQVDNGALAEAAKRLEASQAKLKQWVAEGGDALGDPDKLIAIEDELTGLHGDPEFAGLGPRTKGVPRDEFMPAGSRNESMTSRELADMQAGDDIARERMKLGLARSNAKAELIPSSLPPVEGSLEGSLANLDTLGEFTSIGKRTPGVPVGEFGAPGAGGIKTPEQLARAAMEASAPVSEPDLTGLGKRAVTPSSLDATGVGAPKARGGAINDVWDASGGGLRELDALKPRELHESPPLDLGDTYGKRALAAKRNPELNSIWDAAEAKGVTSAAHDIPANPDLGAMSAQELEALSAKVEDRMETLPLDAPEQKGLGELYDRITDRRTAILNGEASPMGADPNANPSAHARLSDDEFGQLVAHADRSMTDAEKEAARAYSNNGLYALINGALRRAHKGLGGASLKAVDSDIRDMVSSIDKAMTRSPAPRAMTLVRGLHDEAALKDIVKLKVGDSFVDPAFVSTSYADNIANDYAQWIGGTSTSGAKLDIAVPEGYPMLAIPSEFSKEKELLLGRGGKFTVTGISEATESSPKIIRLRLSAPEPASNAAEPVVPDGFSLEHGKGKQFTSEPRVLNVVPQAADLGGSDGLNFHEHVFVVKPSDFAGRNLRIPEPGALPEWSDSPSGAIEMRAIRNNDKETIAYSIDKGADRFMSAIAADRPVAIKMIPGVSKPDPSLVSADEVLSRFSPNKGAALAAKPIAVESQPTHSFSPSSRQAGGSQGGRWYTDENGTNWFGKTYRGDVDRQEVEHLANRIYREFGISAPETEIAVVNGKRTMMSKELPGRDATPGALSKSNAGDGFVVDAWLANWDVVGTGFDNMLLDVSNEAHRIDNGGSLIYRAQGGRRDFSGPVRELETMRNRSEPAGEVFGHLSDDEVSRQIAAFAKKYDELKPSIDRMVAESSLSRAAKKEVLDGLHERAEWLKAKVPEQVPSKAPDLSALGSGENAAHASAHAPVVDALATPASDDLSALLQGTSDRLKAGESMRSISAPAEAKYVAEKAAKTEAAATHFRGKANAKNFAASEMGAAERAAQPSLSEAMSSAVPTPQFAPEAATPQRKNAPISGLDELFAKIGEPDPEAWAAYDAKTKVSSLMPEDMQRVADDAAIERLLKKRNGKNVDMGPSLERAAQVIGEHEQASADVADLLGANAPKTAVDRAAKLRSASQKQAERQAASAARAADDLERTAVDPGIRARVLAEGLPQAPTSDATVVEPGMKQRVRAAFAGDAGSASAAPDKTVVEPDIELSMALARENAKAQAKQSKAQAKAAGAGGGVLGAAADAGTALELLGAMGVHTPMLSKIPLIGPVLGAVLKARAVLSILGRKGGSVGRTTEALIAQRMSETQDRINGATQAILTKAGRGAKKLSEVSAGPAVTLGYALFPGGDAKKTKDLAALYHARMDELARAQVPGAIDAAIGDRYQTADAELQNAIAAQVKRGLDFIASKAPRPVLPPGMLPGDGKWRPSKAALDEWGKYIHAVNDPASVLEDLAKGHFTLEGAETLRVVYPELFKLAQMALIKAAPQMQARLPIARQVAISIMYRIPVTPSMQPQHMAYLAAPAPAAAGPGGAGGGQPAPQGAPGLTGPIQLGQSTMTSLDKRAGM